jgi:hypothetical protein
VFRGFHTVPLEDLDPIARQPGLTHRPSSLNECRLLARRLAYQGRRGARLHTIELVIDRGDRDLNLLMVLLIGRAVVYPSTIDYRPPLANITSHYNGVSIG